MSARIVLHRHLSSPIAAVLVASDHRVKEAASAYALTTFSDGRSSGPAGLAIQIAVRIKRAIGKAPEEYTDSDAMRVAAVRTEISEALSDMSFSPERYTRDEVKQRVYALIDARLLLNVDAKLEVVK